MTIRLWSSIARFHCSSVLCAEKRARCTRPERLRYTASSTLLQEPAPSAHARLATFTPSSRRRVDFVSSNIVFAEFQTRNLIAVNLVRTIGKSKKSGRGVGRGKTKIIAGSAAAVRLDCPIDHLARHVRYSHLDHRDLRLGGPVPYRIHHVRCVEGEQTRLLDHDARFRDTLLCYG